MKVLDWAIKRLYIFTILSLVLLLLSQTLGRVFWFFELFSHFVPHYLIVVFLTFVLASFKASRNKNKANSHFVIMLMTVFISLFFWCFTPIIKTNALNTPIKIAYHNININNPNFNTDYNELISHNPDLVLLIEPNPDNISNTLNHQNNYKLLCGELDYSPFSLAILIKNNQNANCEILQLANHYPVAKIEIDNKILFAIHPPPPISQNLALARNQYLTELAMLINNENDKSISVIGDMNASAFSPVYRDFIKNTNLTRTMTNAYPTWLPFGISIDQILIKNGVANVQGLNFNGSDHLGFYIELE